MKNRNLLIAFIISSVIHIGILALFIVKLNSNNTSLAKEKSSEQAFGISFAQIAEINTNQEALAKQEQPIEQPKPIEKPKPKPIKKPKPKTDKPALPKEEPKEPEPTLQQQTNIVANNEISSQGGSTQSGENVPKKQGGSNLDGEIYKALKKHMSYPKKAIEQELEGRVIVEFKQLDSKNFEYISVIKSSGYKVLDKHAIKIVQNASHSLPIESYNISVKTPIIFDLSEI